MDSVRFERGEDYRNGFEDALELCIAELNDAKDKDASVKKLMEYLGLVKEDKLERLKEMLFNVKKYFGGEK